METLACALLATKVVTDSNLLLLSRRVVVGAFCQRAFERLEPCAVKVASTVLRGESGSNAILLPDLCCP